MRGTLKKLGKLKGRGADEWRVRGAQALAAAAERARLSSQARLPDDAAFFRLLDAAQFESTLAAQFTGDAPRDAARLLEHFRRRARPRFFAAFDDRAETIAAWRRRFGSRAEQDLIQRAEDIVAGRFTLLGHGPLRFGDHAAPDWHLEPLSGRRAPLSHWSRVEYLDPKVAGDKKVVWELNRHQHFMTLGRAYFLTGDERYAETFAAHLRSWAEANPPKLGINWASSLEVALRSISWLWALYFFRESARLTPELLLLALKLLYVHARHIETYLSTYFSPNTHLTGEALGLFYLGTLLPELKAARRWRETGERILLAELARQVRPDGVYFEQASYYHRYTADFYTHLLVLSKRNEGGAGQRVEEALAALLDHLMQVTRPDGRATLYGDDDGGRLAPLDACGADDFRAPLSTGAALLGRADYKHVAGELAEETFWLLGPRGAETFDCLVAREPAITSRAFPDGGIYVMRDGWARNASYMLIDCGPHGALSYGHSHADALSFELVARGRALLLDPGTYNYTGSRDERDYFRSTAAHNALVVGGLSSSEPAGPFSWRTAARATARAWVSRPRFDYFEGEHDGYARLSPPAMHARAVLFLKGDYFVMRDAVTGGAAHNCELYFHFAPGTSVERTSALPEGDEAGLDLFVFGADEMREERGWVSRCYGARQSAPVRAFVAPAAAGEAHGGEGTVEVFTFLVPLAAGERGAASAREVEARGGRAFELKAPGGRVGVCDLLLAGRRGELTQAARLASDFELTWARLSPGGELEEAVLIGGGSRLTFGGQPLVAFDEPVAFALLRREGAELILETETDGLLTTENFTCAELTA
jgi:hypothetical protein